MEALHEHYPDDDEAAIFYALEMRGLADDNDKTLAQQKRAAEILLAVLPRNPNHPGVAHYLIHSFDYPSLAEKALPAARVYAKIAPMRRMRCICRRISSRASAYGTSL
jgi:hypothetical protein